MRVSDILLEYRERIDRYGSYGQWIDTRNGKVYPVQDAWGHENIMRKNAKELFTADEDISITRQGIDLMDYDSFTELGFIRNIVRVEHEKPENISFSGLSSALKASMPFIIGTVAQKDVNSIRFDVIEEDKTELSTYVVQAKVFQLPTQRKEAIAFINGL